MKKQELINNLTPNLLALFEEAKYQILKERPNVDVLPYSHNIISIILQSVYKTCGKIYANLLVEECNLEPLGWNKVN